MKKLSLLFCAVLVAFTAWAQQVETKKDSNGWRLFVESKPFPVYGVVWSYTPIDATYTYDLWSQSDEFIMKTIDSDMKMMKAMGVNTIRVFSTIPPRWVEYIYVKFGIYTMINDLLGRYGISVRGKWHAQTDYSDLYTRQTLIAQAKKTAQTYKNTPGVLMYMLGNESNYGLVWSGSNIENLPQGEQNDIRAGYMYSLMEEAMVAVKSVDPARPVGIVNGDTQYLQLIKELCPSLDILGVNAYRGYEFLDTFYSNVAETLGKPIVFTEAGADAFNAVLKQEDQYSQADYIISQWKEIYEQAYGKGKSQNVLGAYVFEWMDEWWKHYQTKNLDVHDTTGTWANAGYIEDYEHGINNMDEEWFGITAQAKKPDGDGFHRRLPRAAYFALQDIWKTNLYSSTNQDIANKFLSIKRADFMTRGLQNTLNEKIDQREAVKISTLSFSFGAITGLNQRSLSRVMQTPHTFADGTKENITNLFNPSVYAEAELGITIAPVADFTGTVNTKVWTNPRNTRFEKPYAYYGVGTIKYNEPYTTNQHILLYSGSFAYTKPLFEINGYYHTGRDGWELYGDTFNLMPQAFDIPGYDYENSIAPVAIEFVGKDFLNGFALIAGPEVYLQAAPQIAARYYKSFGQSGSFSPGVSLGVIAVQEFGERKKAAQDPHAKYGGGTKASLYADMTLAPFVQLKASFLTTGNQKIGAYYISPNGQKQITLLDTFGVNARASTDIIRYTTIYVDYVRRGLVADTSGETIRGGWILGDSGSGNREQLMLGADFTYGIFNVKARARYQTPLEAPFGGRSLIDSPFAVFHNRQRIDFETVFTVDLEGGTWFYEWNVKDIENSKIAASLAGLYTLYAGPTDKNVFKMADGNWAPFPGGLPRQLNLWAAKMSLIGNPVPNLRLIGGITAGHQGSFGNNTRLIDYWGFLFEARYKQLMLSSTLDLNAWGAEAWYREHNNTYPLQWNVDLSYGIKIPSFMLQTNRVGLRWQGKSYNTYSADPYGALPSSEAKDGVYSEFTLYFNMRL